jgi:putative cell wall-binding protein
MRSARDRAGPVLGSMLAVFASIGLVGHGVATAATPTAYAAFVERIGAAAAGIGRPLGIAYAADRGELVVVDSAPGRTNRLRYLTHYGAPGGISALPAAGNGSIFAFDATHHALLLGDGRGSIGSVATAPKAAGSGSAPTTASPAIDGMALDPRDGSFVLLVGSQLRRADAVGGSVNTGAALATIPAAAGDRLVGPTVDAQGAVLVLDADASRVFEFGPLGDLRSTRDVAGMGLRDPRGIVVAPSGDQTDAPTTASLYVADAGTDAGTGAGVVEVALSAPVLSPQAAAVTSVPATLVQTIDTSNNGPWTVSSTDPSGVGWASWNSRLVMTDGEIEEPNPGTAPWWAGANGFVLGTDGGQLSTFDANQYGQNEPVGVALDAATHLLYSSHDSARRVYVISPGPDAAFNEVGDSLVREFSIAEVCDPDGVTCVDDPEGLAFQPGHLYIGDAHGKELWDVAPGSNGIFDGVPAAGGDDVLLAHFDTSALGQQNPEGLDYSAASNSFWMVSNVANNRFLSEVSLNGTLIQEIALDAIPGVESPSGIAIAPRSTDATKWSAYIADRGIDNSVDAMENDGKIFEVAVTFGGTPPPPPRTVVRLAGANRYETAAKVSQQSHPSPGAGLAAAYVASGENFPDALSGAPAANRRGAPILLVQAGSIPTATSAELTRLKPNVIYVLGGTSVVSTGVQSQLAAFARSGTVVRLAGSDRYATAVAAATDAFPATVSDVMVATGAGFADALAGGGAASQANMPILLVQGNAIPAATATKLGQLSPSRIWVLGGTASISAAVETQLHAYAGTVTRLAGDDRYETAVRISRQFFTAATGDHLWVATGALFPDALTAGASGDPVLLTLKTQLPVGAAPAPFDAVDTEIGRLDPSLTNVLGGTAVVADSVLTEIRAIP